MTLTSSSTLHFLSRTRIEELIARSGLVTRAGIGRTSSIPGRQKDNFGIGYYYLAISHDLKKTFQPFTRLPVIGPSFDRGDEQGVEIFYNWNIAETLCGKPSSLDLPIPESTARRVAVEPVAV